MAKEITEETQEEVEEPKITVGDILRSHEKRIKELEAALFRLRSSI